MSGDVHLDLWLHEYKMDALSSVLAEQGATVEERMNDMLLRLYEEQVPSEIQQRVRASIQAEYTLWEEGTTALELEQAEDPHTAFHVRENGADRFFVLERSENLLCVANMLRGFYENRSRAPALTEVPKLVRPYTIWQPPTRSQRYLIWTLTSRSCPQLIPHTAGGAIP